MKNFSKLLLTNGLLLCSLFGFTQQPQWYIKNNEPNFPASGDSTELVDFRPPAVSVSSTPVNVTSNNTQIYGVYTYEEKEGNNAIYDDNGDLEIFIAHNAVFDATGHHIYNLVDHNGIGQGVGFSDDGISDRVGVNDLDLGICKVPGSCTKYYVIRFSADVNMSRYKLHYYIYDISTHSFETSSVAQVPYISQNDPGEVPGVNVDVSQFDFMNLPGSFAKAETTSLAISKLNNDGERLMSLVTKLNLAICKISSSGITMPTSYYSVPPIPSRINSPMSKVEHEIIKLDNGNYRVCATTRYSLVPSGITAARVKVFEFSNNGTYLTTKTFTTTGIVRGMEFSPNGDYLYITQTTHPYLQYIDLTQPVGTIQGINPSIYINSNSGTFLTERQEFRIGAIEVGHDGNMYFASLPDANSGKNNLSAITNPNDPANLVWHYKKIDNIIIDEVNPLDNNGDTMNIEQRMIPLPDQVDGELLYTPMTNLGPFYGCGFGNTFQACVDDYPGFEYNWYNTSTGIISLAHPTATGPCFQSESYDPYGTYLLRVTDENNCTKSYTVEFVNTLPQLPQIANIEYCSLYEDCPSVGWYYNISDFPTITSIDWYFNGNPVDAGSTVALSIPCMSEGISNGSLSIPDEYTAVVNSPCGTQTFSFTVTDTYQHISGSPIANINLTLVGNQALFSNPSTGSGLSHQWTITRNGNLLGVFSNNQMQSFPFSQGDYFVVNLVITDYDQCKTYSRTQEFFMPESTEGGNTENPWHAGMGLNVYPNPVTDIVNLSIENASSEYHTAQILSLDGRVLIETNVTRNQIEINMSELSTGTYFAKVFNEFESVTSTVVKQ